MRFFLIILLSSMLLSSCATSGGRADLENASAAAIYDKHSRALYLYSRARLATNEGDYPAALTLLRDALGLDSESAFLHTAIAEIKLKIGQVLESLEFLNKSIKLDPSYREPYVMAGAIKASAGKDFEAADYLRKAIKLDPSKEDAYLQLAVSLTRLFEYEESVNTLKRLVALNNESVLGFYYLGRTYSQMKLYRDAVGYFKRTLELRPDFSQAAIDMAASYEALGDYPQAIEVYHHVLDADDNRADVLQRLIQLLIQQRRFEEALEYLNIAIESGLGGQETLRKIGLVHLELEQFADAIKVFKEILDKDPAAYHVRLYQGMAYEEKGDLDSAYAEFAKIPRSAPSYNDAIGHMAFILKEKGKVVEAIDLLKNAIAVDPTQIELHLNLSALYEAAERPEAAIGLLLEAEKSFANEPRLLFRLGVLYDKLGKKQESIERMKSVIKLNPKDVQALNFLGYTYAEMGINLDEALGYIKQAIELRPNDGFILDSLGWVYYKLKRYDEAVRYLQEATNLVDDDTTILEHLGDVHLARRDFKKALKAYKNALEQEPGRKELLDKIRKIKGEHGDR